MTAEEELEGASVVGRRALIKRAVAAGAVAWTAPLIVDSLASPAAAGTVPLGAHSFTIGRNTANCLPTGYPAANVLPSACITPTTHGGAGAVTFTVTAGCRCTFTAVKAWRGNGNACTDTTTALPAMRVSFPRLNGNQSYAGFKFVLTCS